MSSKTIPIDQLPFAKPGRFWKGNLHTHSTRSDGGYSPEDVCFRYREAGYDFISLTDHFLSRYKFQITDTRAFHTEDFTTIIGAELHTDMTEFNNMWHILAVGLPNDFSPPEESETAAQMANRAMKTGAYVAVAHPAWYSITEKDIESIGMVDAIEVFNGVTADDNNKPDSWQLTDVVLGRGLRYNVCATDDFHGTISLSKQHDFGRGWVQVRCENLEPYALLAALKAGHYYSSTGPEIHDIQCEGSKLLLRCSPVQRVFLTGKAEWSIAVEGRNSGEFEIDFAAFDSPFGRLTVRGVNGGYAWSNPIWFD